MTKKLIVDPNSGHLYGFPKAVPDEFVIVSGNDVFINPSKRKEYSSWLSEQCENQEIAFVRQWVQDNG